MFLSFRLYSSDHTLTCAVELPGTFVVWAASDEAKFLNGKFVWAHWDVDDLKAMKKDIEGTDKFTLGLLGWP
jgi:hypothetical protein